jgi:hypothetical protein
MVHHLIVRPRALLEGNNCPVAWSKELPSDVQFRSRLMFWYNTCSEMSGSYGFHSNRSFAPVFRDSLGRWRPYLVVLTQRLGGFSIDQMYPGAGRTVDRLVLVFGNIWIIIQLVLALKPVAGHLKMN